jgi:hypothetical protein
MLVVSSLPSTQITNPGEAGLTTIFNGYNGYWLQKILVSDKFKVELIMQFISGCLQQVIVVFKSPETIFPLTSM